MLKGKQKKMKFSMEETKISASFFMRISCKLMDKHNLKQQYQKTLITSVKKKSSGGNS